MQGRINEILSTHAGGIQVAWNEIAWNDGAIVLTLSPDNIGVAPLAVGNCPSGSFCAYDGANYSGNRLAFTTCPSTNDVSPLGKAVRSIANSRTSGSIQARNGSTVVHTISANSGLNTTSTISHLVCS
ncbi:MAG: peptidase inhibitor family I36 protein [Cellulomonadaceae bacterium]|nr:peptidase inhibitor family I36 protein [Cellulomonadaceae bacterium]